MDKLLQPEYDIIIVGGGPVGLFLALSFARKGIKTVVIESESDIAQSPRALGSVTIPILVILRSSILWVQLANIDVSQKLPNGLA
jgi:2-polyprenyl-6-methoxyphenol hydroxylase-like FAD-dependent oxidoreductase